ncbi:MAG: helix-turn-helix transcriptional regulator [Acidobacteria bacterium]|nr:helix-turn-helix transcriptional regulator [Acidobacteriota bacterium]MBI3424467.1 helix-turn-helix transcriptional regulator [Acidobacteriota bacterium]
MSVVLKPRLLRPQPAPQPNALGECSFIIDGSNRQYHWQGTGCLSIKTFAGGAALYNVGRGRFRVAEHSYLLLNQNQPYEIIVDAQQPLASFCLFFENGLVEEVQRSLTAPTAKLLDEPQTVKDQPLYFFEKTYPHDDLLSPALFRLRTELPQRQDDEVWLNEHLHQILRRLLTAQQLVQREVESFPALRATTRAELYRRLHRDKEFIAASFEQSLTLDEIARIACLSPSHFLRTFQQAFRQTPHQFLTTQRLARAQYLLRHTGLPVTEICFAVGFESLGSFSTLFRRHLGRSPAQFRQAKR